MNRLTAVGNLLYQRVPFIFICSLCLYGIVLLGTQGYYRFMPGSWFLHVRGVPAITNGNVDDTLNLTFCRDTRYDDIKAVGARSYYKLLDDRQSPAGNYTFHATIEHHKACQYIPIAPSKHPRKAGTYLSHTDLTFYVNGHRKVVGYDTTSFKLTDTKQSLQQQIEDLQRQIQDLRDQQASAKPSSVKLLAQTQPATSSGAIQPTQVAASSPPAPSGGGSTVEPPSSTPEQPQQPRPTLLGAINSVVLQSTDAAMQILLGVLK